jgi:hypothetical protein
VSKLASILPCPFCGSQPETEDVGEGRRGLMIFCIGDHCPNPSVSYRTQGGPCTMGSQPVSERLSAKTLRHLRAIAAVQDTERRIPWKTTPADCRALLRAWEDRLLHRLREAPVSTPQQEPIGNE